MVRAPLRVMRGGGGARDSEGVHASARVMCCEKKIGMDALTAMKGMGKGLVRPFAYWNIREPLHIFIYIYLSIYLYSSDSVTAFVCVSSWTQPSWR